jgi:hypothetical protein
MAGKKKAQAYTTDQIARRRIAKKVAARNAQAREAAPLFAEQVPVETVEGEYWKWRRGKAMVQGGEAAAELWSVDRKWTLRMVRAIARQVMGQADFDIADSCRWTGDVMMFWRDVLTGCRRIVLEWERIDEGMRTVAFSDGKTLEIPRVTLREKRVWPDPGWVAPLTGEQFDRLVAPPVPLDFEGAVDPLNLRGTEP